MLVVYFIFIIMISVGIISTVIRTKRSKKELELDLEFKKAQLEKMRLENEQKKLELEKYKK